MTNVFVLTPGRTGSTTFGKACSHISNYSVAQESNSSKLGESRLKYPNFHIEIDSRLMWFTALLEKRYKNDAKYVYLRRNPFEVARSYNERWYNAVSVVRAFAEGILMRRHISKEERFEVCEYYAVFADEVICDFVERNNGLILNLENINEDFPKFFDWISAQGDKEKCLAEFETIYNRKKNTIVAENLGPFLRWVRRFF